ncbi:MAG: ATP-binding cassette domain-containing protein [Rhodocyclaceae bacterium]|nr:ATP-binding cassette domain-containing protein [Rhodocyclaceae bacterium]MDZ4216619.1 ATP-binding cassette domain-containing protein [Rhodocyclaceae bacterium]
MSNQNLLTVVLLASELAGQKVARDRVDHLRQALAEIPDGASAAYAFNSAWVLAGLEGQPYLLQEPSPTHCPFAAFTPHGWFVVLSRKADGTWRAQGLDGRRVYIPSLNGCECVTVPPKPSASGHAPTAMRLIWGALAQRRGRFVDAVLASALINVLALATSLYSMQVYDRVIPNHGYQTLWVLSVGVAGAILFEFMLKHVRAVIVDNACKAMDCELSEWFFQRALSIRMEGRPPGVGALASQVRGFELVRGIMTSTSLFVLVDIPFAIMFVGVIGIVGGALVLVPVVALPCALLAGLLFQHAIGKHAAANLAQSHLKTGLMVESIDGAESLKAMGAEWRFMSRWKKLVADVAESDLRVRRLSVISQNLTAMLQQVGYVALVAFGAYLVADNVLTMGALIACSILIGRAMASIAALPSVMVQWAHAKAALDGLDQIIKMPNENDERDVGLIPQQLEGSIRFEKAVFAYGTANHQALEVPALKIAAGERVGILGGIGSGKSTLLKLASGLFRPTSGKVFIGGLDAALIAPALLREKIGYLPQDFQLFSGSLRDNLLMGLPDPGDDVIFAAAQTTGIIDLITQQPKGLALTISEGGRGVSGGQKQLIGLTRLLLARPSIWILDEPTSSMDVASERRIMAMLEKLGKQGVTMLIATHKTTLIPLVSRLMFVQGGRVGLDGPREQVLAAVQNSTRSLPAKTVR